MIAIPAVDLSAPGESIMTAVPAELSVAPVPVCQVSKWAPIMTTSFRRSLPGISPITLTACSDRGPIRFLTSSSTVTGISRCRIRYIRL